MQADTTEIFEWQWDGTKVRVGYDVRGDGPTVLMLPAFSTVSTREELAPLARRLDGFRVVLPDWPGFGAGRHPKLLHGPALHSRFLTDFAASVCGRGAAVVAAGHASGHALAAVRADAGIWSRIALLAPTWRGPFPTMMGGRRPIQDRLRAAINLPLLGHALYRLNVSGPMIATMYRRHVYADAAHLTPAFLAAKAVVARRGGGRFGSGAFVTGGLDVVADRPAFLALAHPPAAPTLLVYGANTPPKSRAEMEALAALPGIETHQLPRGALAMHEEYPDEVAAVLLPFLHAA